ncbi:hypothetical protein BKA81DRAFT_14792 [Phyllosticta paracitricarpa]
MSRSGVRSTMQRDGMMSCAIGKHSFNPGQDKTHELSDVGEALVYTPSPSVLYSRLQFSRSLTCLQHLVRDPDAASPALSSLCDQPTLQRSMNLAPSLKCHGAWARANKTTRRVFSTTTKSRAIRSSSSPRGHYPTRRRCRAS